MINVAILGYGTVGSGVFDSIMKNQNVISKNLNSSIGVKKILEIREILDENLISYITKDFNDILNDKDISIVVETMGGIEPAYTYIKNSLLNGKTVVTSNKELVEKHGDEFLSIASNNNVNFLFEASVGGGIPIIRPLVTSFTSDDIYEITGILNGTTNYILTKMDKDGISFLESLNEAIEKGFAEKNPKADIEGYDSGRKIAILLSIVLSKKIKFEDIYVEGISKIRKEDFHFAKKYGGNIKLIATSKILKDKVMAFVSPVIIENENHLSSVDGVFNSIIVKGNIVDEVMFYGKGAGKFPTASAVISDIIDGVKNRGKNIMKPWDSTYESIISINELNASKLIGVYFNDLNHAKEKINNIFGDVNFIYDEEEPNELAFLTVNEKLKDVDKKIDLLKCEDGISLESSLILLSSLEELSC